MSKLPVQTNAEPTEGESTQREMEGLMQEMNVLKAYKEVYELASGSGKIVFDQIFNKTEPFSVPDRGKDSKRLAAFKAGVQSVGNEIAATLVCAGVKLAITDITNKINPDRIRDIRFKLDELGTKKIGGNDNVRNE